MEKILGVVVAVVLFFFIFTSGVLSGFTSVHLPLPPSPIAIAQQAPTPVHPTEVHVISKAAVLSNIKSTAILQTTSYRGTAVVEEKRDGAFFGLLNGESFKIIAVGEIQSGIDLSRLNEQSIEINGDEVVVHLPAPIIVSESLNEDDTFVAGHNLSWFAKSDPALAEEGRRQALKEIHQKACEADLEQRTERDASLAMGALIKQFGFTSAQIYIDRGSTMCSE